MRFKTIFPLVGLLLWWCTACQTPTILPPVPTLTATYIFIPAPTPYSTITSQVQAPDGQVWGTQICLYWSGSVSSCRIEFLNGARLGGDLDQLWSPDNLYNVACVGTDSVCGSREVWNMATGETVLHLHSNNYAFTWDPNQPSTALYFSLPMYVGETEKLILYNFATGQKRYLAHCPSWFETQISNSGFCQRLIATPTPEPPAAPMPTAYPGQIVPSSSYP